MAVRHIPLFGASFRFGSADAFLEPSSVKDTNDLFPRMMMVFNNAGSVLIPVYGAFQILNPTGGATVASGTLVKGRFKTTVTSGSVAFQFHYRAIALGEDGDPTTVQESASDDVEAVPGTAHLYDEFSIALTAANFAIGDIVQWHFGRNKANGSDNAAAAVVVEPDSVVFEYEDGT